ncbi:MAG TPA: hypothetical protein PLV81_12570, partial [Spirochaetota bacterium]|nr:hypothetical protein [Spirochaetota bacterium]
PLPKILLGTTTRSLVSCYLSATDPSSISCCIHQLYLVYYGYCLFYNSYEELLFWVTITQWLG